MPSQRASIPFPLFVLILTWLVGSAVAAEASAGDATPEGKARAVRVYAEQCAKCHGTKRYGGYAPPIIPSTLSRKKDADLLRTILDGRPNTQMESFAETVSKEEARELVAFIREPIPPMRWSLEEIALSRVGFPVEVRKMPEGTRREDIILVVERGTGSISVLDGQRFAELDRFPVGRQVHGGPKFDRAYEKVFAVTRDGTVVYYDLAQGALRAKVKAGVNTRNIAVSPGGDFLAVADQLPAQLVVFDGMLHPLVSFPLDGQPSGVYQVPGEERFLLALRDSPKLLSLRYPEMELREVPIPEPFEDFTFVPGRRELLASSRAGSRIHLYDLDTERIRASLDTQALPHLFSACFFARDGALTAALNHIGVPKLTIVDLDSFEIKKEIELVGSGFFARTHSGTPYIWVDTNTEQIQLVDKKSLELLEAPIVPEPGKKAMHTAFTRDGARALISVWDPEGSVVVYDSKTLRELRRLPYNMPIGKYNAHNKTRFMH